MARPPALLFHYLLPRSPDLMTLSRLISRYLAWVWSGARPAEPREIDAAREAAARPAPEEGAAASRAAARALRRLAAATPSRRRPLPGPPL
jgi:hypothetical protein